MIEGYIIPACKDLELTINDVKDNPELTFEALGQLKLDERDYAIRITVETSVPDMAQFDLRDLDKRLGHCIALPFSDFDVVAIENEANPVAVMISEAFLIINDTEHPLHSEYVFEY